MAESTGTPHHIQTPTPVILRLLGQFGLVVDDDERASVVPVRSQALLAFLALHPGGPHTRQRLAFLLWPDSAEGQARTNLRNVLHHLRRACPELDAYVDITPTTLCWVGGHGCRVDVTEFLEATESAEATRGSPEHIAALQAAVEAYDGDLLEGSYEEWLEADRALLRDRFLSSLRQLTQELIRAAEPVEAVRAGRELVRRDPLSEDHHRLLMSAYAAAGDRAGAMRAWHQCVDVLAGELGVAPSEATSEAYARLLDDASHGWQPSAVQTPKPSTGGAAVPLVGREDVWAELTRCWLGAESGRAHLVLVTGEAGIGKTRVVEELASWCERRQAVVARARSYSGEGELGYGVVIEWLRSPAVAAALRRVDDADRRALSRLLPELARDGTPMGSVGEADRLLLFEATARALVTGGRPVLLVADDAHWCDAPSLQLLHFLVRSAPGPVLVVATARREDLDETHALRPIATDLLAIDHATEVGLVRLDERDTGALAASLVGDDVGAVGARLLYAETEGNPLFIVEAIRSGWDGSAYVDLTPRLQSVIEARLRRLSDTARHLSDVAATIGRAFTVDLLGRAAGLDDLALARGLDELWRRGVLRSHGPDGYDFTHGKLREVVYDALSPAVRAQQHLAVAEALGVGPPLGVEAVSGQIAAHYDRAGRAEAAVDWYPRAAVQAMRLGVHDEAVRVLERALELLGAERFEAAQATELELLTMLPPALGAVDGFESDRLTAVQQRAAALAGELGVELAPPMLRSLVMASLCRDDYDEAGAAADRLLASARRAGDEGLEIETTYLLGITAFWRAHAAAAAERFESVVRRFDAGSHPEHVLRFGHDPKVVCLSRLANALWFLGRSDEARHARDQALALAAQARDPVSTGTAAVFGALLAMDLDEPDIYARTVAHFADGSGLSGAFLVKGEALLGYLDVLDGRADRGVARIVAAFDRCDGRNLAPGFRAAILRVLVAAHVMTGDAAGGLAATDLALGLGGTRLWEPEIRRRRAEFTAALGGPAGAVAAELDLAAEVAALQGSLGPAAAIDETRDRLLGKRSGNAPTRTVAT